MGVTLSNEEKIDLLIEALQKKVPVLFELEKETRLFARRQDETKPGAPYGEERQTVFGKGARFLLDKVEIASEFESEIIQLLYLSPISDDSPFRIDIGLTGLKRLFGFDNVERVTSDLKRELLRRRDDYMSLANSEYENVGAWS